MKRLSVFCVLVLISSSVQAGQAEALLAKQTAELHEAEAGFQKVSASFQFGLWDIAVSTGVLPDDNGIRHSYALANNHMNGAEGLFASAGVHFDNQRWLSAEIEWNHSAGKYKAASLLYQNVINSIEAAWGPAPPPGP